MTNSPHPSFIGDQVAWDRDRLVVTSPKLLARIDKPYLSASTAKAMDQCPAGMVGKKAIPEGFDLFAANNRGSAAHEVLETLYQLPPERRDATHAMRILVDMANREPSSWNEVDYAREIGSDAVRYASWIAAISKAYSGIFAIEDPKEVQVYKTEMRLDGVEVAGVPFKGFIDRVDIMPDETFRVVDHKGLAMDTPIPTPTGWTTMGDLEVGDEVLSSTGHPTRVTIKSGVHHRPCYQITFSDGASVICDNVHLWQVADGVGGDVTLGADHVYRLHQFVTAHPTATSGRVDLVPGPGGQVSITSMEPVASVPTQCIQVDAPDSLYLCGPTGVPTHNTGKDKSKPNLYYGDDHGDQGRLYKSAFETATGQSVKHVYMYYIEHGKSRRVAISKADVRKTERGFADSWKSLRTAVGKAEFVAKPSNLCGWCPLANACPVAKAATNAGDPRAAAPTQVELGIPVLRQIEAPAAQDFTGVDFEMREPPADYDDPYAGQHEPTVTLTGADHELLEAAADVVLQTGTDAAHVLSNDNFDTEAPIMTARREGKAWEARTPDGLNLNSYAAMGAIGLTTLAADCLAAGGQKLARPELVALTSVLAKVVLNAQAAVTGGSTDWAEGANTRVRGALRTFIDSGKAPMPFGGTQEHWDAWVTRATGFSVATVQTGMALFDGTLEPDMSVLLGPAPVAAAPDAAVQAAPAQAAA